jgi:hypothetical protein
MKNEELVTKKRTSITATDKTRVELFSVDEDDARAEFKKLHPTKEIKIVSIINHGVEGKQSWSYDQWLEAHTETKQGLELTCNMYVDLPPLN